MLKSTLVVAMLTLSCAFSTAHSQNVRGNLEGRILNAEAKPLSEVNVELNSPSLQGSRGTASDANGYFRFPALPVGTYQVTMKHIAYREIRYENIQIRLGKTTSLGEIQLEPRTIEMSAVTVVSAKSGIDPASTTLGDNLTIDTIQPLPVERNFRSIATLIPQANTSYFGDEVNISGATGLGNAYYIDGVNVTSPYRSDTSTNLPYNFIREIEIKTGGYEAEYRSALGGVLNVVTQSGGNEFHGQVFGFFANNTLSQRRKLLPGEAEIGDFSQSDFGLSFGGPIVRDKFWFFGAYNPNFEREDIAIPGFGFLQDSKTTHIFAGKLSWQATEKTNVVFSAFGDPNTYERIGPSNNGLPSAKTLGNLDPFIGDWGAGGISLSLRGRHILNSNGYLEAAVSRTDREVKNLAGTAVGEKEPLFIDLPRQIWSGGYGVFLHTQSSRTALKAAGTFSLGSHILKAGFEYEDNFLDRKDMHADLIFKINDSFFLTISNAINGKTHARNPSLFVQDSWLLGDRLRLNLGLRWDAQYVIGSDGKQAQTITDMYQPRVGFTFQPGEIGSQKVFGSYGRFYEILPLFFSSKFISGFEYIATFSEDPRNPSAVGDTTAGSGPIRIPAEVKGLEGQYFDEFTLGYERQLSPQLKVGVRGIYRNLGQAIEDGRAPEGNFILGNPGKGELSFLPEFNREYVALELTLEKTHSRHFNFLASYVLSRNYGNYPGLYDGENGLGPIPNSLRSLDIPEQILNSTGLLPNDRTHSFKFNGSYHSSFGLTIGSSFSFLSGTPLTEFGGTSQGIPNYSYLTKRGSLGRTPAIWDINFRLTYSFPRLTGSGSNFKPRLILDILHLASARETTSVDQIHFAAVGPDGNQAGENPSFLQPRGFQRPMSVRLGLEVGF